MPDGESFSPASRSVTSAGARAGTGSRADGAYRGPRARIVRRLAQHRARRVDIVLAADVERDALMELGRLDVQHALRPVAGGATCLLDDESERIGLVEEAQLAAPVAAVGWISEQASAKKIAMEISDERSDVSGAHRLAAALLPAIITHQRLHFRLPLSVIRIIDREIPSDSRDPNVRMREQELAQRWVEREAVRALPRGVDEHCARAIDDVARGDLPAARLQHVLHLAAAAAGDLAHDREDRSNRHVDVDVRRSIERIEQKAVLPATEVLRYVDDVRLFLRGHGAEAPAVINRLDDYLVGEDVELLLRLALHVLQVGRAEDVGKARASNLVGDHLGGEREVVKQAGQLTRRLGVEFFLLDDESLDRDDRCRGVLNHSKIPRRRYGGGARNTGEHLPHRRYVYSRNEGTATNSGPETSSRREIGARAAARARVTTE